jgi:predicted lysophospholipase L1 biosynthesis ABC-type transport system permease subunit
MGERQDDQERLLGAIAAGSAILFAVIVASVVMVQTLGPAFGVRVGVVSDMAIGSLIAAVITLTTSVGLREWLRRNGRNGK